MNRIEAIRARTKYASEPHLVIVVDGMPLDEMVEAAMPESSIGGLVSSLLGWFHHDEDSVIPWQRILPEIGCTGYAPILICPDDLDYACTVVMAEVFSATDTIQWHRLGFNASRPKDVVGSCIRWELTLGSFTFTRTDYEICLNAFRALNAVA
jgi:hypothetical protein